LTWGIALYLLINSLAD